MANKKKTRMYEPWGYQEENNYNSTENTIESDFESFLVNASYNRDDNKIHFTNKDGVEKASIDVSEFVKSDSIIEDVEYSDGILKITFTNGDIITINLSELIDENEFKDGLIVDGHIVKVLVDSSSDKYISVGENGVKVTGIEADIQTEETRAASAETALDAKIDAEISRATDVETQLQASIDTEVQRAQDAESALNTAISNEVTRAEAAEAALSRRNDMLNDALDGEKTIREAADVALGRRIDTEIADRTADVDAEEQRALAAEAALQSIIEDEADRAISAETSLQNAIDAESQRAISAETELAEAISGKADADAVYTQEEVDALIKAKETEIYNLTKLVGEIGGNVVYDYPNDLGTSLTSLLNNSGTVKLGEDATISRFGPGMMASNKVKLNLNNHNLTATAAGSQGAIMSRGTQEITIGGKGTIDAGSGVCIEANGKDSTINLTGSTTVYQNDRSGGELIYCYAGTINITNGTFRNNGEDKTYMLNCYDANYAAGTAKIIVTGGKFYDFDPGNNTAEGPGTSFLAEGYHTEASTVVEEGVEYTVYTVKKDA